MSSAAATGAARAGERELFGHPRGLAYIIFAEAWERFSFYGMQALLVLYLSGYLFQPAHINSVAGIGAYREAVESIFGSLSTQALATQTFGLYAGFVYFTPVIGGWAGDRFLGRTPAVTLGAVLMVFGHFLMAFEAALLVALLMLLAGCGLLKGNLAAQVGSLYPKDETGRRDRAFSLYYLGVNLGAFAGPLVCGTLGEIYGWHYGFAAAGVGMAAGILVYLSGRRWLPPDTRRGGAGRPKLHAGDGRIIGALFLILALTTLFWVSQSQVWDTYPLWLRDRVNRAVLGGVVPITWFQSLDSLLVLVMAPVVLLFWRFQAGRKLEPGDLTKVALGCLIFGSAFLWLVLGEWTARPGGVFILWPVLFHLTCAVGYLYVVPIALALFARTAPASVNALMVSIYYWGIFFGSIVSGWLGRFYGATSGEAFWGLHAAIAGAAGILFFLLRRPLQKALHVQAE
jgi:POT family proton-dependent oligopeptide transporter